MSSTVPSPSASATPIPPPDGDVDKGVTLLIITAVSTVLALIAVGMRMFVRITIVKGVGWDDYAILTATALAVTVMGFEFAAVSHGLGRHSFYLGHAETIEASKWSRAAVPPNLMASEMARVSVCLFMLRIVAPRRNYTMFLWGIITLTLITTLASALHSVVGCRPIEKLWNKAVEGVCSPPRAAVIIGITQCTSAVLSDWLVALFPALILKDLNMAPRTKIALAALMGLGVFAGVAALIKAQQLYTLGSRIDVTWDTISLTCWSIVEQNVGILAVSIPPCRPLFRRIFKMGSSNNNKYNQRHEYDLNTIPSGRVRSLVYPNAVSSVSAHKPPADGQGSESSLVRELAESGITKTIGVSQHSEVLSAQDSYPRHARTEKDRSWFRS